MWKCYRSLKEAHPHLIFENSASGGKRTDLGMLTFSGRMHRSDNQDPLDAVSMFETMSYFIPPKFHGGACFVSNAFSGWFNSRRTPIQTQGFMGMMSSLSVSLGLQEVAPQTLSEIKWVIAMAKKVREVVQMGDLYRLVSVLENPYGVYQYVSRDTTQSVVFIMGQHMHFAQLPDRLCLKALKPDAQYRVTGHGTYYKKPYCRYEPTQPYYYEETPERTKDYGIFSGNGLMHCGLPISLRGDNDCELLIIEQI
jgi:alpha-galactosidase